MLLIMVSEQQGDSTRRDATRQSKRGLLFDWDASIHHAKNAERGISLNLNVFQDKFLCLERVYDYLPY